MTKKSTTSNNVMNRRNISLLVVFLNEKTLGLSRGLHGLVLNFGFLDQGVNLLDNRLVEHEFFRA